MPSKDKAHNREVWNAWYAKHPEQRRKTIAKNKIIKRNIIEWVSEYKSHCVCVNCGMDHPAVLDYHHMDPSDKDFEIGMAAHRGLSIKNILKELEKCVCICSNCHRILHWDEKNGGAGMNRTCVQAFQAPEFNH